jgi:purine-binding chemotaxis protein CheW
VSEITTMPINWDALWNSLENVAQDQATPQDHIQARLKRRAQQYAEPLPTADDEATLALLSFRVGSAAHGERYGLLAAHVSSVRPLQHLTRVPHAPPFYRGVVNVRGRITSVLDLRRLLGMSDDPDSEAQASARELVIVAHRNLQVALLADHVEGVQHYLMTDIIPAFEQERSFTVGVTTDRLVVLDIQRLLESERLIAKGQAR